MYSDWEDVTSSAGRRFRVLGPATRKVRLPTVDRLTGGTRRRLVPVERSDRLLGRLRTGTTEAWGSLQRFFIANLIDLQGSRLSKIG